MWAIIRIVEDSTYAVVPVSWLVDDNTCYYPDVDSKTLNLLVARAQEPGTNWDVVLIELMDKNIDSFEYCMSIIACLKKGVTSENEKAMSKRKKSSSMNSERSNEESDSSLDDIQSFKKIQTPKKTRTITSKLEPLSPVQSSPIISPAAALRPSTEQVEVCSTQESSCRLPKQSEHYCVFKSKEQVTLEAIGHALCVITRKLEVQENNSSFLKEELRAIRQAIEVKERVQDVPNEQLQNHEELFQELPLNSVEEVDLFEEQLKRKDLFQACMTNDYAICKLHGDGDEIVNICSKWLVDESNTWYPPKSYYPFLKRLLKRKSTPSDTWVQYPVTVISYHGTFEQAEEKLREAYDISNSGGTTNSRNAGKRKHLSTVFHFPFGGSSSGEENNPPPVKKSMNTSSGYTPRPSLDCPPLSPATPIDSPVHNSPSPNNLPPVNSIFESNTQENVNQLLQCPSQDEDNSLIKIQSTLDDVAAELKCVMERLDQLTTLVLQNLVAEDNSRVVSLTDAFGSLPLNEMMTFEQFEEELDNQKEIQLVDLLSCLGGRDLQHCIHHMLRRVMIDQLATKFSYSGKTMAAKHQSKAEFRRTKLYKCIVAAAQKVFGTIEASEANVANVISKWLQQAKCRVERRAKKPAVRMDESHEELPLLNEVPS
ncbi:uncharacterized protein LOC128999332 [Macrosteles quadrilineatus]|uniref:uncharacterized protein LOC128999332 n=1 Tax=Macrosteles quadrilineatus TaxID=74068 RepID=UPI0023E2713C|nr:uncharacterized protein LOC128999332 [Macrosteles quadrilineatus]